MAPLRCHIPRLRENGGKFGRHKDTVFGKPIVNTIRPICDRLEHDAWNLDNQTDLKMRRQHVSTFACFARVIVSFLGALCLAAAPVAAQQQGNAQYSVQEIVDAGHGFFGSTSGGLAKVVENAFAQYGLPNGYILGEEASGAFIAGLRFGEGTLFTKNAGEHRMFWQGPSLGLDAGGDGARTMMLVYDLPAVESI